MKLAMKDSTVEVEGRAAVYTVRVPLKRDAIELNRRIRAARGQQHGPYAFMARVRRVIGEAFAGDIAERDRLLAIVNNFGGEYARLLARLGESFRDLLAFAHAVAAGSAKPDDIPPALKALDEQAEAFAPLRDQYQRIQGLCEEIDPHLRDMLADNEAYASVYHLTAAELLLVDAVAREGHSLPPFHIVAGRVSGAFLEALPDEDLALIGDAVYRALHPSEAETKNSASPSGTSPGGENSTDSSTGAPTPPPPPPTTALH